MADVDWVQVWMKCLRFDKDAEKSPGVLQAVTFRQGVCSEEVQSTVKSTFDLEDDLILKLRNHRGSLIPVNSSIHPNSKTEPYILEVVNEHQFIDALPRTTKIPKYNETMKKTLEGFLERLGHLEEVAPGLKNRRNEKIHKDIEELQRKLVFLNKRFDDAHHTEWKGMFKKQPLW